MDGLQHEYVFIIQACSLYLIYWGTFLFPILHVILIYPKCDTMILYFLFQGKPLKEQNGAI